MEKKTVVTIIGICLALLACFFIWSGIRKNNNPVSETGTIREKPTDKQPDTGAGDAPDTASPIDAGTPVIVNTPTPGVTVTSPLIITGKAIGPWYFEADFQIILKDANGRELGMAIATAQGPWMTVEHVPFNATLTFETPATPTGTLEFRKDNPSGLPENDQTFSIPVVF